MLIPQAVREWRVEFLKNESVVVLCLSSAIPALYLDLSFASGEKVAGNLHQDHVNLRLGAYPYPFVLGGPSIIASLAGQLNLCGVRGQE